MSYADRPGRLCLETLENRRIKLDLLLFYKYTYDFRDLEFLYL